MADRTVVKELMIDVFEYPHMPYWFTIRQAAGIMKKTVIDAQKYIYPQVILVFDEKYNLIGTLNIRDILRGLVPALVAPGSSADAEVAPVEENAIAVIKASLSGIESKKRSEKPISEIMKSVNVSVSPDDSVVKAAFLMERRNIQVLPVLEHNKKLVGIIRMMEVFQEVSRGILEK
jgi:CBS domain-containing protein